MKPIAAALLSLLALGGCHPAAAGSDNAGAQPSAAADTPVLSAARLVLPAVKGNPGAAYFTLANPGPGAVTVTAVAVSGAARSEMHETVGTEMKPLGPLTVQPGGMISFAPGGKHVMVFGIAPGVAAGGAATLSVSLAGGKTLSAPARVEAAGAAAPDDMAGMKM